LRRALSSKTAAKAVRAREAARAKSPKATGGKSPKVPGTQSARVGVIDLGSNSVRLVVYDGMGRAPQPIFNERALCGLGRKLGETGRLNRQGAKMALENMARFVLAAEAMRVDRLDVVATEAVRAADDGPAFVADLERRFGIMVEVLKGEMEGKLSAYGVVSGIPEARGMMGDLGGGSLEVVTIARGGQPGHCASLPIGPLRLLSTWDKNPKKARKTIDDAFGRLGWLASVRGETFYPVGGAWRALANIHMQQINYPLHVIHEYEMPVSEAKELLGIIMHLSPSSLARIERVPKKRLDTLPLAAVALDRLIDIMQPDRLVFSAQGLREGLLYSKLTPAQRQDDPLLAACMIIANRAQRFDVSGQELYDWIDPLFSKESAADKRLRMAACLLGDIAWNEHPDYRAEQAFWRVLRMPLTGLDHPGRVFLATAIGARYGANVNGDGTSDTARIYQMISPDELDRAQVLGKALRFAFTLSAGSRRILKTTRLSLDKADLTLKLPSGGGALLGEMVTRRFESIAKQLGRKPRLSGAGKKLLDG
jgi:exopolyphosphatase/guanosine-5'-triphosphate,3'-diphosphate pyrophosphatase